jgi:hypothetical protein
MGVEFTNILPPVDENGNPITNIVGFEILRSSREGNKSIVAKGMLNNMFIYNLPSSLATPRAGLYPNYPYNPTTPDYFISTTENEFQAVGCNPELKYNPNDNISRFFFTFHSPDTQFKNPYLSTKELKVYGEINANVEGNFEFPSRHPKHKLITDLSFYIALAAGVGLGIVALNGKRTTKYKGASTITLGLIAPAIGLADVSFPGNIAGVGGSYGLANTAMGAGYQQAGLEILKVINPITSFETDSSSGASTYFAIRNALATGSVPGSTGANTEYEQEEGVKKSLPLALRVAQGTPMFLTYFAQGVNSVIDIWLAILPFRQYALQYISHGLYDEWRCSRSNNRRRVIDDLIYLSSAVQDFGSDYRVNNILRNKSVAININGYAQLDDTLTLDNTRVNIKNAPMPDSLTDRYKIENVTKPFNTKAASHYVAIKQRLRNQYGQIEGIIQVPVSTCPTDVIISRSTNPNQYLVGSNGLPLTTGVLFNGDTYIGRYSEKNTMYFFYDWMEDQPDGYEFDYTTRQVLPYVAYRMNTEKYDFNDFVTCMSTNIFQPSNWNTCVPSGRAILDRNGCGFLRFGIKEAYMYLFNSGIRDFFVESEVNVGLRDWGDNEDQKHYPLLDRRRIFDMSIIRANNYYKYDYSLSASRIYNNFFSWGNVQKRNYNPLVSNTCYVYDPNKIIYSLPDDTQSERDNWFIFLPNNYSTFISKVTCVKPINKSGALILFETESPVQFQGTDQLQTDIGTKLTIGDGGLFSQPLQNMSNADRPYEYGSCQNRLSVINTPSGIYYMSQNQGKIFKISTGLEEISTVSIRWWLASYLPYQLTKQFPDFELTDNPVIGIGCQAIYDNENALVYFCKKDYIVKPGIPDTITYVNEDNFLVNDMLPIKLGDPNYFEDASWTISYDPKTKNWLSYHDWHPNLLLPGKNTFMSISNTAQDPNQNNGIWIHNQRCDLYCNYYGIDYPFEVEFTVNTVQTINTLRSVEYILESYIYAPNCFDRFHRLDFNFDEAVVYNTEQCSGLLKLNLTPKNNAPLIVQYPIVNINNIQILYSKEENKYRFNQFWDITRDRAEFVLNSGYPPLPTIAAPGGVLPVGTFSQQMIWNTQSNGYIRILNNNNLNYTKDPLQRKKFRHYTTSVLLRRNISGNTKMLVLLANTKNLLSSR